MMLDVENLKTHFYTWAGVVRAVDGVSFTLDEGETLGFVGESGSGKTVTALSIMRLVPRPGKIIEGRIEFKGADLLQLPEKDMQSIRGKQIGYIFQDPSTSLNPIFSVASQLTEVIMKHQSVTKAEALERAIDLLKLVEIPDAEKRIWNYPHQFSGGMKQRIAVARALSCNPALLLADEPTTALDVTIQAQILDLMKRLQQRLGMSMMLITHDMGVVAETTKNVVVLYAGRVCEASDTLSIFRAPKHPYTEALLTAVPHLGLKQGKLEMIPGSIPNLIDVPSGCRFHPRCKYAVRRCAQELPEALEVEKGHLSGCLRVQDGEISLEAPRLEGA
jgi:peptide/nickel transport system ATP-binding protein/oligopeptide transport system ATP-binding protein